MKTLEEAIEIISRNTNVLGKETIPVVDAMSCVLAEDIISTQNIPPFDKSAMDGYACKTADLNRELKVIDFVPAGLVTEKVINEGECIKIMTGAMVPNGADIVIMKEHVEEKENGSIVYVGKSKKSNICYKGEDLNIGDLVFKKSTFMRSEHIAVLTGLGITSIQVQIKPKIGIISTGSELVEPGEILKEGQIFNSNGYQLEKRLSDIGFHVLNKGIVKDDYNLLKSNVIESSKECDVLLLSGGVSVGDLDLVPEVILDLGYKIYLTELSTKPGKHTLFARKDNHYILGLPGNPVSAFVQMEIVGRCLLNSIMGNEWKPIRIAGILKECISRNKSDRLEFLPIRFNDNGLIEKIDYHGSAHINALTKANGLLEFPLGVSELNIESKVYVRPLQ